MMKFIFLFLLVSIFINGKAQYSYRSTDQPTFSKKKSLCQKSEKKVSDNDKDENPVLKRKYKSKGIEVANPTISNVSIDQPYTYCVFLFIPAKNTYSSFLYCAENKRGPPSA